MNPPTLTTAATRRGQGPRLVAQVADASGWRAAYLMLAAVRLVTMPLLALVLRPRSPLATTPGASPSAGPKSGVARADGRPFGLSPGRAQALLYVSGVGCRVGRSMPQAHIVAYCGDLGYGAARGTEMMSLMLAFGIASGLISGAICDRIGGLRTLLLGSVLQGLSLALFIPFDSLTSLYVISALFGLFQGGIVPSYAIIVGEHFPACVAGSRVGTVLMFTMLGMALGGWMSGKVFDLTGSYTAAFVNGLIFNLVNLTVVVRLVRRLGRGGGDGTGPVAGQEAGGIPGPASLVFTPSGGAAGA